MRISRFMAVASLFSLSFVAPNASAYEPACDACDTSLCDADMDLFKQCCNSGFEINGWINAGFMGNTSSPNSKFHGPYNAVDRSNELMLNQIYLIGEKAQHAAGRGSAAGSITSMAKTSFLPSRLA